MIAKAKGGKGVVLFGMWPASVHLHWLDCTGQHIRHMSTRNEPWRDGRENRKGRK